MSFTMRKKVKLAFIAHDSSRKATFNKRKKGIMKKVSELAILCDVPACAIIYGEDGSKPELWPPSPISVQQVISKFHDMPVTEQVKNMANQESFLLQRIARAEEQLLKQKKENREMEMTTLMYQGLSGLQAPGWLQGLNMLDLTDLEWVIDQMMNQINETQEKLSEEAKEVNKAAKKEVATAQDGTSKVAVQEQEQEQERNTDHGPHGSIGANDVDL